MPLISSAGISWLESLINFEKSPPSKYGRGTFDTSRYAKLLELLGNPQLTKVPSIQILGTDGKGSVLAFLESLLQMNGKKVCSFISPHLVDVTERFRRDGVSTDESEMNSSLEDVRKVSPDADPPTYFEALNAAFWVWAREVKPDYVLLETGLGGRLDTTTLSKPVVKILTRLERDHFKLLGPEMTRIADEKMAAFHPEAKTVIARQSNWLRPHIEARLAQMGVAARWAEEFAQGEALGRSRNEWMIRFKRPDRTTFTLHTTLLGDHQVDNMAAALCALDLLGLPLPQNEGEPIAISPHWEGRCQVLTRDSGAVWILDGSHTATGGQALRLFLDQIFGDEERRDFIVFFSKDRFPWCYLRGLIRPVDSILLAEAPHPRLWKAAELKVALEEAGWADFSLPDLRVLDLPSAMARAEGKAKRPQVFCGSFYGVGEVLSRIR